MTAVERVVATDCGNGPEEVWIALRPEAEALADADAVDARVAAGEALPLAGATLAVKDTVDVAGCRRPRAVLRTPTTPSGARPPCSVLDLCAVAVPAGDADGGCFGVTVLAPAFHDAVAADVARLL